MCGRGACVVGACMAGRACVAGGMHEHAWQEGHVWWGLFAVEGACVAGETATAADGTHPTRMHSCYK